MLGSVLKQEVWYGTRESTVERPVLLLLLVWGSLGEPLIGEMLARHSRVVVNPPFRSKDLLRRNKPRSMLLRSKPCGAVSWEEHSACYSWGLACGAS